MQLRPTRVKYPFLPLTRSEKIKDKKIPRVGGEELAEMQELYSPKLKRCW